MVHHIAQSQRCWLNEPAPATVALWIRMRSNSMRAAHIVLASTCLLGAGPALAACPVADATVEKAIATKPELRGSANVQVVRDLRTLRDAAVVLDAYEHES